MTEAVNPDIATVTDINQNQNDFVGNADAETKPKKAVKIGPVALKDLNLGFGVRQKEILTVLTDNGGAIAAPVLSTEMRDRVGDRAVYVSNYNKAIDNLVTKGLLKRSQIDDNVEISLTEFAEQYLATHPNALEIKSSRSQERLSENDTGFRLIDYILEESRETDKDGAKWLYPTLKITDGVVREIANHFDMTPDALNRRIYELRTGKGYIVIKRDPREGNQRDVLSNIGVALSGQDFHKRVKDKLWREEQTPESILIDAITDIAADGIEFAFHTGNLTMRKWFTDQSSKTELTEMSLNQLLKRRTELKNMLDFVWKNREANKPTERAA